MRWCTITFIEECAPNAVSKCYSDHAVCDVTKQTEVRRFK